MSKKRSTQHIMEDMSISVLRGLLPKEWVIHDYKPDYGIDFSVEIFDQQPCSTRHSTHVYETLGEMFFVQLKSTNLLTVHNVLVKDRFNIEKKPLEWIPSSKADIQVIKHFIDTSLLQTVQSMGASIPVLLVLVCLEQSRAFFICLNDYIDKILIPERPNWYEKKSCLLKIPILNEITRELDSHGPLRFYGKRAKLYAAFSKFVYQKDVFEHTDNLNYIKHFIRRIIGLDLWKDTSCWSALQYAYKEIRRLDRLLENFHWDEDEEPTLLHHEVYILWHQLTNLNNMFEENCREWFLPTFQGNWSSYSREKERGQVDIKKSK